ncbi:MAG TPA: isocitrate lyase/phosphoenolpyruvate mutase family protein [Gemmatimonadales bacterium]|nr:isocitrate lyase/phosphoenolpyruvate mutase family protein [Gemmatimonadales bacterium]
MNATDRFAEFRRLHSPASGILVLPNAWDAMSARAIEAAGARAIATTSSGVSWSLGRPDGEGLTRDEMLGAVGRIVQAVRIPVTADVEGGYGLGTPADAAETALRVVEAGGSGLNVEDSPGRGGAVLLTPEEQAERIAGARRGGGAGLFINARVDVYLRQAGAEEARFDETVRRARAYVAAGADGIFVPGVTDAALIGRLAGAVGAPLNVMAGPGSPDVAALRALGVARVSVGPKLALAVMGQVRRAAAELLERGSYGALEGAPTFAEVNGMFGRMDG